MDETTMGAMATTMRGVGDMGATMAQMNPDALLAMFCTAEDPDQAIIDLTIPHHAMAIRASEAALEQAPHDEIRESAARVIADQ